MTHMQRTTTNFSFAYLKLSSTLIEKVVAVISGKLCLWSAPEKKKRAKQQQQQQNRLNK